MVSLIDLLGASLHLGRPLSAIFRRGYAPGLFAGDPDDRLRRVALKLQKPCPFLEEDLCAIYPVRPLPCILFPEYLVYQDKFQESAAQEHFRDYLCLARPFSLSPARAKIIVRLLAMWDRESLVSSLLLFGHGPCRLDFGNLLEELGRQDGGQETALSGLRSPQGELPPLQDSNPDFPGNEAAAAAGGKPSGPGIISHQALERFFLERIAPLPPFSGMREKINFLETEEGQSAFLRLFADDRLFKKLKRGGDGRALVFRFAQGKLQARRRSLLPAVFKYY
jgi:hypothetical protein